MKLPTSAPSAARSFPMKPPSCSVRTAARSFPMKLPTSAPSAEQSSTKTSRRLLRRNLHNHPMKKNGPVDEGGQKDLLVVLLVLPVDLAGHLGAEDDGQRKA